MKELAKLETLSAMFDIPLWTLRRWASERRFPGVIKLGRAVRVDLAVFREWIQAHRVDKGRSGEGG